MVLEMPFRYQECYEVGVARLQDGRSDVRFAEGDL